MVIGIGCDIVKIERIEQALCKPVINKILTKKEQAIADQFPDQRKAEWIAGRFAAKEAIFKAIHSVVKCQLWDIEVLALADGSPCCTSFPYDIKLSIAHEKEYAIAYAMVLKKE